MTNKIFTAIALLLLSAFQILAQTSYKGVLPGSTTRAQVEHAFGEAVKEVSATLFEYEAGDSVDKIYVQYRAGASVVERIELLYTDPSDRSSMVSRLKLPARPTASQVNPRGKLEEYYAGTKIVLTYAGDNVQDGVSRVGYYSRELFDSAVAKVSGNNSSRDSEERSASPVGQSSRSSEAPPRGRETTMSTSSGSVQAAVRGGSGVNSAEPQADLAILKSLPNGAVEPDTSDKAGLDLNAFVGTYEFSYTENASQKRAVVDIVAGKLRWRNGPVSGALVYTGNGVQTDANGQKESDIILFKVAGKPDIKLQFFSTDGRVKRIVYFESSGTKSTTLFGTRVP